MLHRFSKLLTISNIIGVFDLLADSARPICCLYTMGDTVGLDSMTPDISDGDIVFVKRQPSVEIGEIGIFIYDGDAYCKKLVYRDKHYYLRSLNSKYKDIALFGDSIYTVGKVILS